MVSAMKVNTRDRSDHALIIMYGSPFTVKIPRKLQRGWNVHLTIESIFG